MGFIEGLSKREHEVVENLLKGMLDKEIADAIKISPDTVRKHNKNIYKKMRVRNRLELIILVGGKTGSTNN